MLSKESLESMLSDLFYGTDDIDPVDLELSGAEATAWNYLIDATELIDHNDYHSRDFAIAIELAIALVDGALKRYRKD